MSSIMVYPSRELYRPESVERREPVVWTNNPSGNLILKEYESLGYTILRQQANEKVIKEIRSTLNSGGEDINKFECRINEEDGLTPKSFFGLLGSPLMEKLYSSLEINTLIDEILGSSSYFHQTRINIKKRLKGRDFGWHSDFETWHYEDGMMQMRALSIMVALSENNLINGSLAIIPGSHKHFYPCFGKTPPKNYEQSLVDQEIGIVTENHLEALFRNNGVEVVTMQPGDVLLFDCNLLHSSNLNMHTKDRMNLFFCINSTLNQLDEPVSKTAERPSYLAKRKDLVSTRFTSL